MYGDPVRVVVAHGATALDQLPDEIQPFENVGSPLRSGCGSVVIFRSSPITRGLAQMDS